MNPRPLGPEPSALPTALHPVKKNRSSWAAAVWLGMRGSNSHGRSQSPLHYHYANPHRICVLGVCPQRSYIIACPVGFVNAFFKKTFTFFVLFRFRRCFAFFHGNTIRWELCGVALGFVHQLAGHMLRGKRQAQHAGTSGGHFLGKIIVIVGKLAAELPANFCLPRGRASPAGCYSRHISRCRSWNDRHIFLQAVLLFPAQFARKVLLSGAHFAKIDGCYPRHNFRQRQRQNFLGGCYSRHNLQFFRPAAGLLFSAHFEKGHPPPRKRQVVIHGTFRRIFLFPGIVMQRTIFIL